MENTIQSDLIRGHINTIILKALFDGDRYGYDIVREIEQKSSGQYKLKQPTLYSCLKRLEIQGFIRSYWGAKSNGGRRKYFTLTDMGKELFIKNQSEWEYSRTVIDKLISDREVDLTNARPLSDYIDESDDNYNHSDEEAENEIDEEVAEETEEEETENAAGESAATEEKTDYAEEAENVRKEVSFSDTTAIMNELLRRRAEEEYDASYADKLVSEKYVSDRTDAGMSSDAYFRDFFDERESEPQSDVPQPENIMSDVMTSENVAPAEQEPEQKNENIFLDYHSAPIVTPSSSSIIEREYRNILGDFLNPSFVEKETRAVEPPEPERETEQTEYTQEPESDYGEETYSEQSYDESETYEQETQESYTSDADVNRKLNRLTGEVREMGDNIVIRTHSNKSAKEYTNTYYYYSNKLMLVHYGILFGIMMLEILFSAVFVSPIMHRGRSIDKWFYIVAGLVAVVFPVVAFVKNFTAPNKRKRINFSLKNSLIYRLIVMAQCFLIIYCLNIIGGMPLSFSAEYLSTLLMPALLCTNFPVSALIFNALFKSKKFAVEQ